MELVKKIQGSFQGALLVPIQKLFECDPFEEDLKKEGAVERWFIIFNNQFQTMTEFVNGERIPVFSLFTGDYYKLVSAGDECLQTNIEYHNYLDITDKLKGVNNIEKKTLEEVWNDISETLDKKEIYGMHKDKDQVEKKEEEVVAPPLIIPVNMLIDYITKYFVHSKYQGRPVIIKKETYNMILGLIIHETDHKIDDEVLTEEFRMIEDKMLTTLRNDLARNLINKHGMLMREKK